MPEYFISSGLPSYPSGLSDKEAALVMPLYRAIGTLAQQLCRGFLGVLPAWRVVVGQDHDVRAGKVFRDGVGPGA